MTLKAQVAHGLKWQAITIVGRQLLSLVVFTTLARLLDPPAFGLVALVGVYNYFASMLADLGLGTALVQKKDLEPEHLHSLFWFNVACNGVLCIATVALAGWIAALLGEPKLVPLLRWSALGLVVAALTSVQTNLFIKRMDFRSPGIRTLVSNLVGGAIGVAMALAGYGVWALVGQQLGATLSGGIFIWRASDYKPAFVFSWKHLSDLLGVGTSVFANAIVWFFSSRIDQLVIGRIAGKLPDTLKSVVQQPLMEVSIPAFSQLQGDHPRMCTAMYRGAELNAVVMFALFGGVAVISKDIVPLLFGQKWADAAVVCALLSVYSLVGALQVFFYPALLASGVTKRYFVINVLQTMGVAVSCFCGIRFGVAFVVLGLIVNSIVFGGVAMVFLRKQIGLDIAEYLRPCGPPLLAATAMALGVYILSVFVTDLLPSLPRVIIHVVCGAGLYAGAIWLAAPSSARRLMDSLGQLKNRKV
jgi:O-antigen/teichoic acid export membrane protein